MVSYRSAYLKTRWPAAFLCARLAEWGGYHHRAIYMAEAARLGMAVRPPHVNHSGRRFSLGWEREQGVLWMGLGQVRDLRRASVRAIVAEREQEPFTDLRDLLRRVPLQDKEATHLVQCGALDGLGESRAALLAETDEIRQAGSALQMTLGFAAPAVEPEPAAQRLAWEQHLLSQPVSTHPLEVAADRLPPHLPLRHLPDQARRRVTVAGVRLPGWTGGQGFFLSDGDAFVTARGDAGRSAPPPWQPLVARGRWMSDEWGTAWFQIEGLEEI
jgi:DNA polymerase III alpha subunit